MKDTRPRFSAHLIDMEGHASLFDHETRSWSRSYWMIDVAQRLQRDLNAHPVAAENYEWVELSNSQRRQLRRAS